VQVTTFSENKLLKSFPSSFLEVLLRVVMAFSSFQGMSRAWF
jgi:hypothetical protein